LLAPSWGGMINGLLTLRGAWDRLRTDPVVKFLVVAITFYGMSTFEGPLMSIKAVNALSHPTNWTVGHAHSGALGWNGFFIFGMLYWLVPRLWKTQLFSQKLATAHFWLGLVGIALDVLSMWAAGIGEGLMWKAFDADGWLVYGAWTDTLGALRPMYWVRGFGGLMYSVGTLLFAYNLVKTMASGQAVNNRASAPRLVPVEPQGSWHRVLEGRPLTFTVFVTLAVLAGGLFEIVPTMAIESNVPTIASVKPYRPLELEGRDI
jgi:cytochrome c oxidase cbb3-type subunit I/II